MEDSTCEPKPGAVAAAGDRTHGFAPVQSGAMPHAIDRAGVPPGRLHLCSRLPAALDGRVWMVIAFATLQGLRDVAVRSDSPLPDILLAVFGLVVDRHAKDGEAAITILSTDPDMSGRGVRSRVTGSPPVPAGASMPLDMRLAIAHGTSVIARRPPKCRGIAFHHARCGHPHVRIAPAPSAMHVAGRQDKLDFDLVLDIGEFDHMLLLECFFRTRVASIQAVENLVSDYAHALQAVVNSFVSEPSAEGA